MIDVIFIADDERFLQAVQEQFLDRIQIYLTEANSPFASGKNLIKDHPSAFVFLDLSTQDPHANLSLNGPMQLAQALLEDVKEAPRRLRFYSSHFNHEASADLLEQMRNLKMDCLDKAEVIPEIEKLLVAEARSKARSRRRADQKWVLDEATVRQEYAGQVVAVYNRHVWGSGVDLATALTVARGKPDCPSVFELFLALVPDDRPEYFPILQTPSQDELRAATLEIPPANA